jgi:hypothetical protein
MLQNIHKLGATEELLLDKRALSLALGRWVSGGAEQDGLLLKALREELIAG